MYFNSFPLSVLWLYLYNYQSFLSAHYIIFDNFMTLETFTFVRQNSYPMHEITLYLSMVTSSIRFSFRIGHPKCLPLVRGLFWTEGPKDSGRVFYLPVNCLKESRGPSPGRELSPEITMKSMGQEWWARGNSAGPVYSDSSLCPLSLQGMANILQQTFALPTFLWIVFPFEALSSYPLLLCPRMAYTPQLLQCLRASCLCEFISSCYSVLCQFNYGTSQKNLEW